MSQFAIEPYRFNSLLNGDNQPKLKFHRQDGNFNFYLKFRGNLIYEENSDHSIHSFLLYVWQKPNYCNPMGNNKKGP